MSGVELTARFNGGNGGVSLEIKGQHDEDLGVTVGGGGTFLSPKHALELAADLVVKAMNSMNREPEGDLADAVAHIRGAAGASTKHGRVVVPAHVRERCMCHCSSCIQGKCSGCTEAGGWCATELHPDYITITKGLRGFFAVWLTWNPDHGGFYEPEASGIGSYESVDAAEPEAKDWAESERLEYRRPT